MATRIVVVLLYYCLSIYVVIRSLFHLFYHQLGLPERTHDSVESPYNPLIIQLHIKCRDSTTGDRSG